MQASASRKSATGIRPALTSSLKRQTSVPEPTSLPRNRPLSIGPPETAMVGRSQLAAPISNAGVVLSQPTRSTTPSIGLPRIDSSTSMLARLRNSIAVGRRLDSPSDITGNSSGRPPASSTPRRTFSAICRKWALQGVSSDQVLQMPITGRPSNESFGRPSFFIQLRCIMAFLPVPPNQSCERSRFPDIAAPYPFLLLPFRPVPAAPRAFIALAASPSASSTRRSIVARAPSGSRPRIAS